MMNSPSKVGVQSSFPFQLCLYQFRMVLLIISPGARAYYIHSTLHNWSDDVCEIVLTRVKEAMKPGYSRLLLNENVIPNIGAHWETTGLDMMMLTLFSAEERTSAAWYDLIERAGLKIVKIWDGGKGVESVIECELV